MKASSKGNTKTCIRIARMPFRLSLGGLCFDKVFFFFICDDFSRELPALLIEESFNGSALCLLRTILLLCVHSTQVESKNCTTRSIVKIMEVNNALLTLLRFNTLSNGLQIEIIAIERKSLNIQLSPCE